ncbi:MAG: ABC transporter permease [Lachnospiraceae bacterium]|nr:ABC transporter permease [Lachnospiraceae bacterium]
MISVFLKEMKLNTKNLLIWSLTVGGLGLACILLYQSMQGDMKEMADAFSNMGAFSDAFGMSTLSIATLKGYFATEVGTVHGLGSGMFAAIIAIGIISKEEEGHTGEFLFSLPVSRTKVLAAKGLCISVMLLVFTLICGILYAIGFVMLSEEIPTGEFVTFMLRQLLMNAEIAGICFAISSLSGKNRMGTGLGLAMIFYVYDLIGRVVPDMKDYLYLGPYSYANASEIFSGEKVSVSAVIIALIITVSGVIFAFVRYNKRDLAS